jgi:hypothetical protein
MAENRIGQFDFLTLYGAPHGLSEQLLVDRRAAVAGVAIWKQGLSGTPFQLQSYVDAPDFAEARAYHDQYLGLKGADPVDLVYGGIALTSASLLVAVLDVRLIRVQSLAIMVGGLNPPSRGAIRCNWQLIAISIAPDEQAAEPPAE